MNSNPVNYDQYMRIDEVKVNDMKQYDVMKNDVFTVLGLPFYEINQNYYRNHKDYIDMINAVNPNINHLGSHSAGGMITFKTNAQKLVLKAKINKSAHLWHMAATCECGFDLYISMEGKLRFYNVSRCEHGKTEIETTLFENFSDEMREVVIYFPLYSGVLSLDILINEGAVLQKYSRFNGNRWLFYGTSITQGGCATRPGMCYTNFLSRHYSKEIINLGYSGNGLGENIIARMIGEIADLEMVLIDFDANAGAAGTIENTLEHFIRTLKEKNKDLKIVVISRVKQIKQLTDCAILKKYTDYRNFERELTNQLNRELGSVYFFDGQEIFDDYFDEYTVDGVHFTDLGYFMFSQNLIKRLDQIIGN